jgi:hypothetical protein
MPNDAGDGGKKTKKPLPSAEEVKAAVENASPASVEVTSRYLRRDFEARPLKRSANILT